MLRPDAQPLQPRATVPSTKPKQTKPEATATNADTAPNTRHSANNGHPKYNAAASYADDATNPYNQANPGTSDTTTTTEPNTTDPNTATAATEPQQADEHTPDRPKRGGGHPLKGVTAPDRR